MKVPRIIFLFVFGLFLSFSKGVGAGSIRYTGRPIDIGLSVKEPTAVIFPERPAAFLEGHEMDPSKLNVVISNRTIYFSPVVPIDSTGYVEGASGEVYPLRFFMTQRHDPKIEIHVEEINSCPGADRISEIARIMVDLKNFRSPAGSTEVKFEESTLFQLKNFDVTISRVFNGPAYTAYILCLFNKTDQKLYIPKKYIKFPGIEAVSVDDDYLAPRGSRDDMTYLYMITHR